VDRLRSEYRRNFENLESLKQTASHVNSGTWVLEGDIHCGSSPFIVGLSPVFSIIFIRIRLPTSTTTTIAIRTIHHTPASSSFALFEPPTHRIKMCRPTQDKCRTCSKTTNTGGIVNCSARSRISSARSRGEDTSEYKRQCDANRALGPRVHEINKCWDCRRRRGGSGISERAMIWIRCGRRANGW
jgi:hypothetical protein